MALALLVLGVSFAVSVLSGLLGIGGGIIMAPALLYAPLMLSGEPLGMAEVTGLTMTQGLVASMAGVVRHDKGQRVCRRLVGWVGVPLALSALVGALLSAAVSGSALMTVFAAMALMAAVLMALPNADDGEGEWTDDCQFNIPLAVVIATAVGLLGGLVGQGGSFLLIPLMLHVLRLPTPLVIGSNLGVVVLASSAGFLGKLLTGQIPLLLAAFLAIGSAAGATVGSVISLQTRPRFLRLALAAVVAVMAVVVALDAALAFLQS